MWTFLCMGRVIGGGVGRLTIGRVTDGACPERQGNLVGSLVREGNDRGSTRKG